MSCDIQRANSFIMKRRDFSMPRGVPASQEELYCRSLISFLFTRKRLRRTNFHAKARTRMIIRDGWPQARGRREKEETNKKYTLLLTLGGKGMDPLYSSGEAPKSVQMKC